jgi:DNA polymerase delta subunit 1
VAGDHTRTVSIATPTTGGLMSFVKKTLTCLGCKTPLGMAKNGMSKPWSCVWDLTNDSGKDTAVCKNCRTKLPELYQKHVRRVSLFGDTG